MSIKSSITKLKSIKNIEIIIVVILCLVILCIYLSGVTVSSSSDSVTTDDFGLYIQQLEDTLCQLVCAIDGVEGATVAISYDGSATQEYAYDTVSTTEGDSIYTSSEIVLVNGEPLLIRQIVPSIVGVVVVLHGETSAITNMNVLQAVTTLLDIDSSKVEII